jgi:hypothetical protein
LHHRARGTNTGGYGRISAALGLNGALRSKTNGWRHSRSALENPILLSKTDQSTPPAEAPQAGQYRQGIG